MTQIKVVLANILVYFMSLFMILRQVAQQIEQLQRDFLWKGVRMMGGSIWWFGTGFALSSIKGLGLRNLDLMNKALLQDMETGACV